MEAGNYYKDECLPEKINRRIVGFITDVRMTYSQYARKYLVDRGLPKESTYVTDSIMVEKYVMLILYSFHPHSYKRIKVTG